MGDDPTDPAHRVVELLEPLRISTVDHYYDRRWELRDSFFSTIAAVLECEPEELMRLLVVESPFQAPPARRRNPQHRLDEGRLFFDRELSLTLPLGQVGTQRQVPEWLTLTWYANPPTSAHVWKLQRQLRNAYGELCSDCGWFFPDLTGDALATASLAAGCTWPHYTVRLGRTNWVSPMHALRLEGALLQQVGLPPEAGDPRPAPLLVQIRDQTPHLEELNSLRELWKSGQPDTFSYTGETGLIPDQNQTFIDLLGSRHAPYASQSPAPVGCASG